MNVPNPSFFHLKKTCKEKHNTRDKNFNINRKIKEKPFMLEEDTGEWLFWSLTSLRWSLRGYSWWRRRSLLKVHWNLFTNNSSLSCFQRYSMMDQINDKSFFPIFFSYLSNDSLIFSRLQSSRRIIFDHWKCWTNR